MIVNEPNGLMSLLRGLVDLVWPRLCGICDTPLGGAEPRINLCSACHAAICHDNVLTCPRCTSTVGPHTDLSTGCTRCRTIPFHFARAVRLGPYEGVLRTAVLRTKQDDGEWLAEELGRTFALARREKLLSGCPEVVVPVPLHWRRRWTRGYNQAEAVARELARSLNCPLRSGWLVRTRSTSHQPTLTPAARWENVRGAFRVRTQESVRGVRILLVDDVMTTGATADAAAAALLQAKAAQVTVAILAHR